jgi:hypothetical protein
MNFKKIAEKLGDLAFGICQIVIAGAIVGNVFSNGESGNLLWMAGGVALFVFAIGFIFVCISSIGGEK